ncbi:MAG: hypothetical protein COB66_01305 [Coxiella sp. (in: Bacteria)]|nr:MAG: hypothetical protein COB66_01305 [Coxiella sp. (in: g-proteobacteria)]
MAQLDFSMNLQNTRFSLLSSDQSRTVINPERGGNPDPPTVSYSHNMMATTEGYKTIGYTVRTPDVPAIVSGFTLVRPIIAIDGSLHILGWDGVGQAYRIAGSAWQIVNPSPPPILLTETITVGDVDGRSYIFYEGHGCFSYDSDTNTLNTVTLTGLDLSEVIGVAGSNGYLVAFTGDAIAWSSTLDPTDFVPSPVTGSGGGKIADIDGRIILTTSVSTGLLIYTGHNVVAASYTGNINFPWKLKEVPNSKGTSTIADIAFMSNSGPQFVRTFAGYQSVVPQTAEMLLPEVEDFLTGRRVETFNEVTFVYDEVFTGANILTRLTLIGSRYLVISYGLAESPFNPLGPYTHALIYDNVLSKLSKLLIRHIVCFDLSPIIAGAANTNAIAFLQLKGAVYTVDTNNSEEASGVLILGKLQHRRGKFLTILEISLTNADIFTKAYVQTSLNGSSFTTKEASLKLTSTQGERELIDYNIRETGVNHSVVIIGNVNLVDVHTTYTEAGDR